MNERVNDDGRWVEDGPNVWVLVEPSEAWIAAHPPTEVDPPPADPAETLREALLDALAPITPSSTSTTLRAALLALRAALQ